MKGILITIFGILLVWLVLGNSPTPGYELVIRNPASGTMLMHPSAEELDYRVDQYAGAHPYGWGILDGGNATFNITSDAYDGHWAVKTEINNPTAKGYRVGSGWITSVSLIGMPYSGGDYKAIVHYKSNTTSYLYVMEYHYSAFTGNYERSDTLIATLPPSEEWTNYSAIISLPLQGGMNPRDISICQTIKTKGWIIADDYDVFGVCVFRF